MKRAKVVGRRQLGDGRKLLNVCCPGLRPQALATRCCCGSLPAPSRQVHHLGGTVTGSLDRTDLKAARAALQLVCRTLAARGEPCDAFARAAAAIDALLASASGSEPEAPRDTEYVDTCEAAKLLGTSERWARDLAPRIGGAKVGGRWLIPKAALPEPENNP